MKIAFFGTPPFTAGFLDVLEKNGYYPSLIVTGPDRPVGRGMRIQSPEPKAWGGSRKIYVIQPEKLDDKLFIELSKTNWDLFVVVAYGKIIPEHIINLPKFGTINVHYSLLPKYRGASPVESAILNGDKFTGMTIQKMKFKLDSGDILVTKEVDIGPNDTTPILREKLNIEALELLPQVINSIFDNSAQPTAQNESEATHCKKIKKEDGEINLDDGGVLNDRKYRAYFGWPGVYFFQNGKRVKITLAHLENGSFVIDEVIPENGKRMPFAEFQNSLK